MTTRSQKLLHKVRDIFTSPTEAPEQSKDTPVIPQNLTLKIEELGEAAAKARDKMIDGSEERIRGAIAALGTQIRNEVQQTMEAYAEQMRQRYDDELKHLRRRNVRLFWGVVLTWIMIASNYLLRWIAS